MRSLRVRSNRKRIHAFDRVRITLFHYGTIIQPSDVKGSTNNRQLFRIESKKQRRARGGKHRCSSIVFFEEIRREEGVSVRLLAARAGVSEEEMEDYLAHGPYLRADIEERVADALCLPAGENAPLRVAAYYRAAAKGGGTR